MKIQAKLSDFIFCTRIMSGGADISQTQVMPLKKHGIGELLVKNCPTKAKELGFKILQFNAVVATNTSALKLYKKLGFTQLGIIPKGFLLKDGSYEDIIPHYIEL